MRQADFLRAHSVLKGNSPACTLTELANESNR